MSGLAVDAARCVGCRRCEKACATAGIVVEGRLARVTDSCVLCGACVDVCPVGALAIERAGAGSADLAAWSGVWVFAEQADGAVLPVAFELLGKARELAAARGCAVTAVLGLGADCGSAAGASAGADAAGAPSGAVPPQAARLLAAGADKVLLACDDRLAARDAGVYAPWIADLARDRKPEVILYGATPFGRELAPGVAVRLRTGLTADCTVLEIDPETGLLQQTRPAFGGNLMATIECPAHRPQMATVRPGVFAAYAEGGKAAAGREPLAAPAADDLASRVTSAGLDPALCPQIAVVEKHRADGGASIAEAPVLVVAGRGIGSKKNLALVRRLAELLGGEVGCTRPLVEMGWLEYRHQVGQTGVSVAPKLLIALGVSGAIQHLAGIGGAETVIAVNEDAEAPIMSAAAYAVRADCAAFAKELIAQLEARA